MRTPRALLWLLAASPSADVGRSRPRAGCRRGAGGPVVDERWQVRMPRGMAVRTTERSAAIHRVVAGINNYIQHLDSGELQV